MKKKVTWLCVAVVVFLCIVFLPLRWWTCPKHQHHYSLDSITTVSTDSVPVDSIPVDTTYVVDTLE